MPMDKSRYPADWAAFSLRIRGGRAAGRCEQCGAENYKPHPETGSRVVLTVAHLDAKGGVCRCEEATGQKCALAEHVLALCQRCHLIYDTERHKFNRRRTRARSAGQGWLGDMEARFGEAGGG